MSPMKCPRQESVLLENEPQKENKCHDWDFFLKKLSRKIKNIFALLAIYHEQ